MKYYCKHCKQTIERESMKKWIKSYCEETGKNTHLSIRLMTKEDLGDKLCDFCPLEKKGVYSVPGGFMAGCEGSRCDEAYDNYLSE